MTSQSETSAEQAVRAWREGRRRFGSGVVLNIVGDFYGVFVRGELRSLRADATHAIEDAHAWAEWIRARQ